MNLDKFKLAQLKLMSASIKFRKGEVFDLDVVADALEATSDAIGELAGYLDKPLPIHGDVSRRKW